jgi:hypothetical protein
LNQAAVLNHSSTSYHTTSPIPIPSLHWRRALKQPKLDPFNSLFLTDGSLASFQLNHFGEVISVIRARSRRQDENLCGVGHGRYLSKEGKGT